jgi:hypothetical protein
MQKVVGSNPISRFPLPSQVWPRLGTDNRRDSPTGVRPTRALTISREDAPNAHEGPKALGLRPYGVLLGTVPPPTTHRPAGTGPSLSSGLAGRIAEKTCGPDGRASRGVPFSPREPDPLPVQGVISAARLLGGRACVEDEADDCTRAGCSSAVAGLLLRIVQGVSPERLPDARIVLSSAGIGGFYLRRSRRPHAARGGSAMTVASSACRASLSRIVVRIAC